MKKLAAIHEEAPRGWWPDYVPPEDVIEQRTQAFRATCSHEDSFYLVAEKNSQIIGFHWIDIEESYAHIKSLWVHPSFQGQGLARVMKSKGEEWARTRRAASMKTSVHFNNRRMLDFNLKNGFEAGFVPLTKKL